MSTEIIRYQLPASQRDRFVERYRAASEYLLADPHCHRLQMLTSLDDPRNVVVLIVWDSVESHEKFSTSPNLARFLEPLRPYLSHIVEMADYETKYVLESTNSGASSDDA